MGMDKVHENIKAGLEVEAVEESLGAVGISTKNTVKERNK